MRGESHVAFQAFRTYAELGPGRRLVDVSGQLSKSVVLMQRWSKRWSWQARVAAWDSAQWQRDAEAKQEERDTALKNRLLLGQHMQRKVAEAIGGDKAGLVLPFDPNKLTAADIARWADFTGMRNRMIALSLNSPTEHSQLEVAMQEHQLPPGVEVGYDPLSIDSAAVAISLMLGASRETTEARRRTAADLLRLAEQYERDDVIDMQALPEPEPSVTAELPSVTVEALSVTSVAASVTSDPPTSDVVDGDDLPLAEGDPESYWPPPSPPDPADAFARLHSIRRPL